MTGRNHLNRDAHFDYLFNFARYQLSKRHQNVCVIRFGFLHKHMLINLVGEPLRSGIMLAESVVWHKDLVFNHVSEHAVRPVNHGRFNEPQGAFSKLQLVACFHGFYAEVSSVMFDYGVFSPWRRYHSGVFGVLGNYGQAA